jgi:prevent-host-death family protein
MYHKSMTNIVAKAVKKMKFFSIREFRNDTKNAWAALDQDGRIVITNNGKPKAIVLGVDDSNLEDMLLFLKRAELASVVAKMQRQSEENQTDNMTMEEINAEIAAVRRGL